MTTKVITNRKLILLLSQICILAVAVLYWFSNRGDAFQKTFALDEFIVADSTVVIQDVSTDENMSQGGVFMDTPALSLEKGVYQIEISYNADRAGSFISVNSPGLKENQLRCTNAVLNPNLHHVTMTLELTEAADDVSISVCFSGKGYLSITNVGIYETSALYKRTLFYSFLLCVLLSLIYVFVYSDRSTKGVMLALTGIFVISCSLLFEDYVLYGDDIYYHLLRIEGIQKGLSMGTFPVKIHPVWAQDYGYAVGVFYGDAALYFPAILRLMGFSVQAAYKFFVAAMNLGTIIISYFSFRHMFQSRLLGVLGSMFCSLNFYRMFDVYRRAAVGECLGIMMFPLVLFSFYLVFMETNENNWWKHAILTAFSLTGLVQSHILSCEMAFVLILLICIILIKKVFQKLIFRTLASAAVLSVLMNLGFGIPFLDFYNEDILIGSSEWVGSTYGNGLQATALDIMQIFTLISKTSDSNIAYWGRYTESAKGAGMVFGAGILFFVILIFRYAKCRTDKNFYPAVLCFILGCLMFIMSSKLFPWDALVANGGIVKKLCFSIEFPWRLLAPGTILLSFSLCYAISVLRDYGNKTVAASAIICLVVLLLLDFAWFIGDRVKNGAPRYLYATEDLDTMLLSTNDYLPTVTNPAEIEEGWLNLSGISSLEAYSKRGTEIQCRVAVGEQGGFIDFPLNYYRYYFCSDSLGEMLQVSSGHNGMLRVSFPANYQGNIQIAFEEPWYWRLGEVISVVTVCGCLISLILMKRRENVE